MIGNPRFMLAVAPTAAMLALAGPASADAVEHFYKGKTVTVMVPSSLGATLGLYGRLTVEHLGKHIPGNPNVIIQSRPGGGGTKGAAYAYNAAPKDGTFIAEVLAPSALAPLLRDMKFDASKFQWLGSITPRPAVISVCHSAPVSDLAGARKTEAILGSTGLGSETFLAPTLLNHIAGTKFKVVKGYKGGAQINKAIESGEVHGRMNYWSGWTAGKPAWLSGNKLRHIVSYGGNIPELSGVPGMASLAKTQEQKDMVAFLETAPRIGMGFWVAPEVPKERVAALRAAFKATMRDPAFLADAKKRKAPVAPVDGEVIQAMVKKVYDTPSATIVKLKSVFGFK